MKHFFVLLILCGLLVSTLAHAQPPQTISYQGLLTTSSGTPIADGNYNLTFKLYTDSTGGTAIWTEAHSNVPVLKGTFNVILGTTTSLTGVNFSQQLYVGVTKGSDPEFSPREALTSSPSSLAPWAISGDTLSYTRGNVGIGTTDPGAAKLAVWGGGLTVGRDLAGTDPIGLIINPDPTFHRVAFGYYDRGFIYYGSNSPFQFIDGNTIFDTKVGIGTTSPAAALDVNGATKLGSGAPAIMMKKLTGTTASSQGGQVEIAHGLTHSKILSIEVIVEYATPGYIHEGYTNVTGYQFNWFTEGGSVKVVNISGNSGNILSRPIKILITYEE